MRKKTDPKIHLPQWNHLVSVETALDSSKAAIANLRQAIEFEKVQPLPPPDPRVESDFREFVKARVAVEPALQRFLKVQDEYIVALDGLKQAFGLNRAAADFNYTQLPNLPHPLIRLDFSNKIILEPGGK